MISYGIVGLKPATLQLAVECLLNHLATNCYYSWMWYWHLWQLYTCLSTVL